jgi:two-component system LytT family response regulator
VTDPRIGLRVVVVDDEAPARAKLRRFLADEPDAHLVAEAATGPDAVRVVRELAPDVVLLDVQMPGFDGFGVLEAIGPEAMPDVIFVTAHDQHAVRAFEIHALDFLLKPVTPARFHVAFDRVRARAIERRRGDSDTDLAGRVSALLASRSTDAAYLKRILVEDGRAGLFVPIEQIDRVEADRNYVRIHVGNRRYALRTTISALAGRLDPALFLRVNRSTLVRLDAVRAVHPWSHGDYHIQLTDGTMVTWSRRYRALSRDQFG